MAPSVRLGKTLERNAKLASLARRQHGLVSGEQMVALGLSRSAIARRLASEDWRRILPGVYSSKSGAASPKQRFMAVALWLGERGAFSHRSALELYGFGQEALLPWRVAPAGGAPVSDDFLNGHWQTRIAASDFIEVSSESRRVVPAGIRMHHTARLPLEHTFQMKGLRVTSPARTLLDVALILTHFEWMGFVDAFIDAGWVTIRSLREFLATPLVRSLPGRARMLRWLRARRKEGDIATMAEVEDSIPRFFRRRGFPVPVKLTHPAAAMGLSLGYPQACVVLDVIDDVWTDEVQREQSRKAFVADGWRILPLPYPDLRFGRAVMRAIRRQLYGAAWPTHGGAPEKTPRGRTAGALPLFNLHNLRSRLYWLAMQEALPSVLGEPDDVADKLRNPAGPRLSRAEVEALRPIILEMNALEAQQALHRYALPSDEDLRAELEEEEAEWYRPEAGGVRRFQTLG